MSVPSKATSQIKTHVLCGAFTGLLLKDIVTSQQGKIKVTVFPFQLESQSHQLIIFASLSADVVARKVNKDVGPNLGRQGTVGPAGIEESSCGKKTEISMATKQP